MAPRPTNPNHPLVKARLRSGFQQKEVARRTGIPPNTLSRYERGDRVPSRSALEKLSELYGVTVESLYSAATVSRETAPSGLLGEAATPRAMLLDAAQQLSAMASAFIQEAARIPEISPTTHEIATQGHAAIEVAKAPAPKTAAAQRKVK